MAACGSNTRLRMGACPLSLPGSTMRPGKAPGHKAEPGGVLRHIARAPGGAARAQREAELRVVPAGERVELAGAGHFVAHVGKLGRGTHRVGKGLGLDHELGELDVVERAGPVGQLHAGLQGAVALAQARRFPFAGGVAQAFDRKRLAAHAAGAGQGGQQRIARDLRGPAPAA